MRFFSRFLIRGTWSFFFFLLFNLLFFILALLVLQQVGFTFASAHLSSNTLYPALIVHGLDLIFICYHSTSLSLASLPIPPSAGFSRP